ncbi:hypothetical protein, partial [Escherichia coli]
NKISTTASAQCFPRLARPLNGAVLMRVHNHFLPTSILVKLSSTAYDFKMQTHAAMLNSASIGLKM